MSDMLQLVASTNQTLSNSLTRSFSVRQAELLPTDITGIPQWPWIPQREPKHKKETDHTNAEYRRQQKHSERVMTLHLRHSPKQEQHSSEDHDKVTNVFVRERHVMSDKLQFVVASTNRAPRSKAI